MIHKIIISDMFDSVVDKIYDLLIATKLLSKSAKVHKRECEHVS